MYHFLFLHNFKILLLDICIIMSRNRWVFHKKVKIVSMPIFHAIASNIYFCVCSLLNVAIFLPE